MGWMEPYQVEIHKWFANASGMEYPLVTTQPGIENSLAGKDLQDFGGVFQPKWFSELLWYLLGDSLSQQCVLAAKASCTLGCCSKSVANRSGQVIDPFCLKGYILSALSSFGHPSIGKISSCWSRFCAGRPGRQVAGGHLGSEMSLRKQGVLTTREGSGGASFWLQPGEGRMYRRQGKSVLRGALGRMIGDRWKLEHRTF